jgi:hypothetical protein
VTSRHKRATGVPKAVTVNCNPAARKFLAQGLKASGAEVFVQEVRGHLMVVAIPGDFEVEDQDCVEVWTAIGDTLQAMADYCRQQLPETAALVAAVQKANAPGGES